MERLQRNALIIALVEQLQERGSWCGETHIQKAVYFLQEMAAVPLGYRFVLYKYGPYSFDLNDEITAMRADALLRLEPRPYPYRPSIIPGEQSQHVKQDFASVASQYEESVRFVADRLSGLGVAELERLATALFVTRELGPTSTINDRASRLNALKPHIAQHEANDAVAAIDRMRGEVAA